MSFPNVSGNRCIHSIAYVPYMIQYMSSKVSYDFPNLFKGTTPGMQIDQTFGAAICKIPHFVRSACVPTHKWCLISFHWWVTSWQKVLVFYKTTIQSDASFYAPVNEVSHLTDCYAQHWHFLLGHFYAWSPLLLYWRQQVLQSCRQEQADKKNPHLLSFFFSN